MANKLTRSIHRFARRFRSDERGQSIIELAVSLPFLVLMTVGTFAVGVIVDRHLTLGQLVRNAGNMFARGVSFVSVQNKQHIIDAAVGLDLQLNGGKSAVYMSKLVKIPANCSCTNADKIVIAERFEIGDTNYTFGNGMASRFGMPANISPVDGTHPDIKGDADAQATVPAEIQGVGGLQDNENLYAVEVIHRPDTIAFQGIFAPDIMYSRAYF